MNAMTDKTEAKHELSLSREIDAPPALVYRAWTEHLAEWFAPKPLTTHLQEVDFRAGGRFRFTMKDPGGAEYPCDGVFLEVVPNRRIVSTDAFRPGWQPSDKAFMVAITTFDEACTELKKMLAYGPVPRFTRTKQFRSLMERGVINGAMVLRPVPAGSPARGAKGSGVLAVMPVVNEPSVSEEAV